MRIVINNFMNIIKPTSHILAKTRQSKYRITGLRDDGEANEFHRRTLIRSDLAGVVVHWCASSEKKNFGCFPMACGVIFSDDFGWVSCRFAAAFWGWKWDFGC